MSASTAELTLILKAKNLADIELGKIRAGLEKVAVTAGVVAGDVAEAFKGIGRRIANQLGNLATDILSGGSIQSSLLAVGATAAGAMVEGLSAHLLPGLLAKIGSTTLMAPLAAEMAAGGVTVGTALSTAIAVGMAALPFVLAAAAVAALVYLATNPEARQKAHDVAVMILGAIGDGLKALPGLLADIFRGAFRGVLSIVTNAVGAVIGVIDGIIDTVKEALRLIGLLKAQEKLVGRLPKNPPSTFIGPPAPNVSGHGAASGGWVGLAGPEFKLVGEKGPEFVRRNGTGTGDQGGSQGGSQGGFTIRGVSEAELVDMVDRGLYFRLQRAAPTRARV